MASDQLDPIHLPGIFGALGTIALGWMKFRSKDRFDKFEDQMMERLQRQDKRLDEHSDRFSTLQTKEDARLGREELKDEIGKVGEKIDNLILYLGKFKSDR